MRLPSQPTWCWRLRLEAATAGQQASVHCLCMYSNSALALSCMCPVGANIQSLSSCRCQELDAIHPRFVILLCSKPCASLVNVAGRAVA
jgi:hypothetical protein